MTKTITTTNTGTSHGFGQLPALFNIHWLHDALSTFDKWDKAFELQNVHYPYDISYVMDEENVPTHYTLDIALAGVGKDNIKLSIKDQQLTIEVQKVKDPVSNPKTTWLKAGISYRPTKLQFALGKNVDISSITSSYKDGLLKVIIPIIKPKTSTIEIKVD